MSNADIFFGEVIGTGLLILFGAGVVAAVLLNHSKAKDSGWIVIAFGWGFAVMVGAYTSAPLSGGHLNPAVTLAIAIDSGVWNQVPVQMAGEMVGAMLGAFLAWVSYYGHFQATEDPPLAIFSTVPAIRNYWQNLATEIIATFALVLPILAFGLTEGLRLSGLGILLVAFLVTGIGLSLGGPTGYAINPARDLGPRIVHQLLPIRGDSDWAYSWVPVVGPLVGAAAAAGIFDAAFK